MNARVRFAIVAALFIPLLSGCVVFKGAPKGKQINADTVRITFTVCASGGTGSTCPDNGNAGEDADQDGPNGLLLGFRLPEGSHAPKEFSPVAGDYSGTVRRSRQYSRVLNDEAPTPVGFKWFGYRSPARFTADHLGVPGPDEDTLIAWSRSLFEGIFLNLDRQRWLVREAATAAERLRSHVDDVVSAARAPSRP